MKTLLKNLKNSTYSQYIFLESEDRILLRWKNTYGISIMQDTNEHGLVIGRYCVCPAKINHDYSFILSNYLNLPVDICEMYMDQSDEEVIEIFKLMEHVQ